MWPFSKKKEEQKDKILTVKEKREMEYFNHKLAEASVLFEEGHKELAMDMLSKLNVSDNQKLMASNAIRKVKNGFSKQKGTCQHCGKKNCTPSTFHGETVCFCSTECHKLYNAFR